MLAGTSAAMGAHEIIDIKRVGKIMKGVELSGVLRSDMILRITVGLLKGLVSSCVSYEKVWDYSLKRACADFWHVHIVLTDIVGMNIEDGNISHCPEPNRSVEFY